MYYFRSIEERDCLEPEPLSVYYYTVAAAHPRHGELPLQLAAVALDDGVQVPAQRVRAALRQAQRDRAEVQEQGGHGEPRKRPAGKPYEGGEVVVMLVTRLSHYCQVEGYRSIVRDIRDNASEIAAQRARSQSPLREVPFRRRRRNSSVGYRTMHGVGE